MPKLALTAASSDRDGAADEAGVGEVGGVHLDGPVEDGEVGAPLGVAGDAVGAEAGDEAAAEPAGGVLR